MAAADASQFPSLGESWQAERLFYTAIPRSFFVTMRENWRRWARISMISMHLMTQAGDAR
jgi:hypothetical protein